MLDRTTNKLLKYIHKYPKNQSIDNLRKNFPIKSTTAFYESYKTLLDEQLIANYEGSIQLTVKGQDFYYNFWKRKLITFFTIFVIPITIAVISALFTAQLISNSNECNCIITCDKSQNG